jgi:hypothetical protein
MGVEVRDGTLVLTRAGHSADRAAGEISPPPNRLLKIAAENAAARAGVSGSVLARIWASAMVSNLTDPDERPGQAQ